jgi:hypothetical protein
MTSATQLALLSQPVMVDGRSAGTWRRLRAVADSPRVDVAVTVHPSEAPPPARALERAGDAYGRFLGRTVRVAVM